ncbi:MAG: universal stress protein [Syntrophorhabdaceae bacterium]|nr:universal stress protein [Syntrophorhabdaceae bacterium]
MFSPKTILVPTDFSEYSDKALQHATDIARQNNARIYLLHVIGVTQQCIVDYCIDKQMVDQLEQQSIDSAKEMIRKQLDKLKEAESVEIVPDIRKGTPYEEILKEQEDKKMDLIVIASHGKTGLLSHLIGSVAEKVSRAARCPVLLVRS